MQPFIVGVRFQRTGKIYHFDASNDRNIRIGDQAVVETSRGMQLGEVIQILENPSSPSDGGWKTIQRRATPRDLVMRQLLQKKEIEAAGEVPIFSYNQTDFVKDRVAVEVQFGKYSFVAYDLFVKHLAFYVGDHIDLGVEILPMKSLQSHMSSGVPYYEGEFYNVVRQGRGVPAVPLIIIGIAP